MVTKMLSLREAQHVSDSLLVHACPRGTGSTLFEVDEHRYIVSGHAQVRIRSIHGFALTSFEGSGVSIRWKTVPSYRDSCRNRPDGDGSLCQC